MPAKPHHMSVPEARRIMALFDTPETKRQVSRLAIVLGLPESTTRRRLAQARQLISDERPPTTAVHRLKASQKQQADQHEQQRQISGLLDTNKRLEKALKDERASKVAQLKLKPSKRSGGDLIRVIIPDLHGSYQDPDAVAAVMSDVKRLDPDEIVLLGDLVDCGGFLAQHHTLGYVADGRYTYTEDIAAGNQFLDRLQQAAPRAEMHYLEGNHEARVDAWAITQALRNVVDADMLRNAVAPELLLRLKERGIRYYARDTNYHGLRTAGVIRLGQCMFAHGFSHSTHAAAEHANRAGGPIVFGHTHRIQSHGSALVTNTEWAAWSVGCLCKLERRYQHCQPHTWQHGYGVQLVRRDTGVFQHLTVHVIDGQSLLGWVIDRLAIPSPGG